MIANAVIDRCASTNDLARALGEAGAEHGTWISARVQEAGRGRLGRTWLTVEGNLFVSLVARVSPAALWSWVPLTTAVAVTNTLCARFPEIDARIKWPNDLWIGAGVEGRKLGGILCEGVSSFIVVGLGLNCVGAPDVPEQAVTSVSDATGERVTADDVRAEIVAAVSAALSRLEREGPAWVARAYEARAAFPAGTPVRWGNEEGAVLGLGDSGELRVRTSAGAEARIYAEDVSVRAVTF